MLIKIDFVNIENSTQKPKNVNELVSFWKKYAKTKIEERVRHFSNIFKNNSDKAVFAELAFCLFTPQSKAVSCWKAINVLYEKNLLFEGNAEEIAKNINNVRFQNNKAKFLVSARDKFCLDGKLEIKKKLKSFDDIKKLRRWIIDNIKGIGYKEAGHFLRNIGLGLDLAILDRHILKNLKYYGAIDEIPDTLTVGKYLEIEQKMIDFCNKIKRPMAHIDLLFWAMQTGGIFK